MKNDDVSHFSTIPASFAIKSNVYFLTHQYLIINNNQSQRALSVSVRTFLWIYFASRRNCGLLPLVHFKRLGSRHIHKEMKALNGMGRILCKADLIVFGVTHMSVISSAI